MGQRVARRRLEFRDRERDFYNFSLSIKTETEKRKVSMSRPRLQISKLSRPKPIETLIFQSCRDRDSWKLLFLKVVKTKTHQDFRTLEVVQTETAQKLSRPRLFCTIFLVEFENLIEIDHHKYLIPCRVCVLFGTLFLASFVELTYIRGIGNSIFSIFLA